MSPRDTIANLCAALLELYPNDDQLHAVSAFALRGSVTESMLRRLCLRYHHEEGPARVHVRALHGLLDRENDDLPITVAEIRDTEGQSVYRVTNTAGTQLHAWLDRNGWESTGWTLGSDFDDIAPVPGREDLPRGAWPVGLAALVAEALDELNTAEPWDGEEAPV